MLRDLSEEIVKGRDPNISVLLGVRDMSLLQESIFACIYQCCGSGTRGLFDPGIRDGKKTGSGSGMNNLVDISESLETIFWVKILKSFDADPGSGMGKNSQFEIRDKHPGSATLAFTFLPHLL